MNSSEKFARSACRQHSAFSYIFMGGMAACMWFQWGPQSSVKWDTNCVEAFTLAATQLGLYALWFIRRERGWNPTMAWESAFFAISLAICLGEFHCGVPYYPWVFCVFLGYMLVALSTPLAWIIGVVASLLYVFLQVNWHHVDTRIFSDWFYLLFPLAFAWFLGLFYRQLMDTNRERARLIDELQTAKKELELARDSEGEVATLRERERVARELHDTLGHQLVTLTVQLEAAQRLLAVDPTRAEAMMKDMQKLSRSSMEDLRRALDNLRASGLGDHPLAAALQTLCTESAQRFSVEVKCEVAAGADATPPAVAEVLWRVAQEGLANAGRHAQARLILMRLNLLPKEIVLRVEDDGVGLPNAAEDKPGHYGLKGLRERVEGLGGTFKLAIPTGGGTVMEARLPLIA